ncbi:MAG: spermidine/putrescine ABC transporter substrate-binding protein [Spirulina sp. SIO3F2]|nr:spermidine/putrescine ABC transporter substrate-binding protein [Spirulina sp. SIO3F2]
MKRLLVFVLLFVLGVAIPVGCAANNSTSTGGANGDAPSVLSIYNWSDYIDESVITDFESQFNATVEYDTFDSNEAMLAKIQQGNPGYDIIVPTGDFVAGMIAEGLLEELDLGNIPNLNNIAERFLDPPFDPGNRYSVPYQWGTIGIGYNTTAAGGEITSWEEIFDAKYAGRVALMEDPRAMLGVILMTLGYDPNTTDPDELKAAKDYLIEHKDVIATFAPDTGEDLLNQGEVDIAVEWNGDVFQVMEENDEIEYVIPEEGTIVWVDNLAIPKDAPNKELAEKFINFVLEPEVSAMISNYIKYGNPNEAALEQKLIDQEDLDNPGIYPPPETFKKLKYANDLGDDTQLYDEVWTELKVAVGK